MLNSFFNRIKSIYFSESWADAVIGWLYKLPLPFWLTCLLLFFACTSTYYFDILDSLQYGDWENITLMLGFSFVFSYEIFIVWYLTDNVKTLQINSPILQNAVPNVSSPASGFARFKMQIFYLFRLLLLVLVVLITINDVAPTDLSLSTLAGILSFIWGYGCLVMVFVLGFKVVKALSIINHLKSQDIEINLFNLSPYYQLSQFTQKTALCLLPISLPFFFLNYLRYNDSISLGEPYFSSSGDFFGDLIQFLILTLGPALIILATMVFVSPVAWVRARIISEKDKLKSELGIKLKEVLQNQDQAATDGDFSKVNDLKSYADILISRREFVAKISDWPWETRVFQEFSAAILIPIGLSLVQVFIDRFTGP